MKKFIIHLLQLQKKEIVVGVVEEVGVQKVQKVQKKTVIPPPVMILSVMVSVIEASPLQN